MSFDTSLIIAALGAIFGITGLVAAVMAMRAELVHRERTASAEAALAAVRRELERVAAAGTKLERRIKRSEQEAVDLAERIDQIELRGAGQCLDQAIDYARRGADPGKLTQHFGLSRGEADLVTRLHGRKKRA